MSELEWRIGKTYSPNPEVGATLWYLFQGDKSVAYVLRYYPDKEWIAYINSDIERVGRYKTCERAKKAAMLALLKKELER